MWECEKCKDKFLREEVTLFCGDEEVLSEEEGGSGDIDKVLCNICYEDEQN
ncbi:hypothetical protein ACSW8S_16360 (plasmid) [Clostridium perfringens]